MITEDKVLEAVTRGSTTYPHRHNPKHIRVRHLEPAFSLIQWVGGSVWNGMMGTSYVPGEIRFVRHPEDFGLLAGYSFWSTSREEHGVFTDKRLNAWLAAFREYRCHDRMNWQGRFTDENRRLLRRLTKITLLRCGKRLCKCGFVVDLMAVDIENVDKCRSCRRKSGEIWH